MKIRLLKLCKAEHVSIRVFEPRNFGSARRRPNSLLVLTLHPIFFKTNTLSLKTRDFSLYVRNFPPRNRELLWLKFRDQRDTHHSPFGIHHEGELIFTYETQAQ